MSDDEGYKQAYERERKIRRQAEQLLEDKSRELYLQNSRLETSYSALKRQQAAMLTQEKLATLGTLSAGIAHEINTPLGFMKSNMESLRQHLENYSRLLSIINNHCKTLNEKDRLEVQKEIAQLDLHYAEEDYPDLLSETVAGIKRVHDIVLHLKNFSQTGEISNGMVNIVESVEDTVTLMGNDLRSNLKLKLELEPADPVPGNPSEINQALVNIILNGKQATENQSKPQMFIRTWQDQSSAYISVLDNGCGMSPEIGKQIFNPFFTTRDVGSGTGMGLAIAYGIVQKHGGEITVKTKEGKGSKFTMQLPKTDSQPTSA